MQKIRLSKVMFTRHASFLKRIYRTEYSAMDKLRVSEREFSFDEWMMFCSVGLSYASCLLKNGEPLNAINVCANMEGLLELLKPLFSDAQSTDEPTQLDRIRSLQQPIYERECFSVMRDCYFELGDLESTRKSHGKLQTCPTHTESNNFFECW